MIDTDGATCYVNGKTWFRPAYGANELVALIKPYSVEQPGAVFADLLGKSSMTSVGDLDCLVRRWELKAADYGAPPRSRIAIAAAPLKLIPANAVIIVDFAAVVVGVFRHVSTRIAGRPFELFL